MKETSNFEKVLSRAAFLRQSHYEQFLSENNLEDKEHKWWRIGMNLVAKDAKAKLKKWTLVRDKCLDKAIREFESIPIVLSQIKYLSKIQNVDKSKTKSKFVVKRPKISAREKKQRNNARKRLKNKNINELLDNCISNEDYIRDNTLKSCLHAKLVQKKYNGVSLDQLSKAIQISNQTQNGAVNMITNGLLSISNMNSSDQILIFKMIRDLFDVGQLKPYTQQYTNARFYTIMEFINHANVERYCLHVFFNMINIHMNKNIFKMNEHWKVLMFHIIGKFETIQQLYKELMIVKQFKLNSFQFLSEKMMLLWISARYFTLSSRLEIEYNIMKRLPNRNAILYTYRNIKTRFRLEPNHRNTKKKYFEFFVHCSENDYQTYLRKRNDILKLLKKFQIKIN